MARTSAKRFHLHRKPAGSFASRMLDHKSAKRTRASVPRPRSGCKTCKSRHVKCDENKPECTRCLQSGRRCEGYPEAPPKRNASRLSALASALSISSYEIPFKIPGGRNDRRIFHYYCVHASNDLAGPSKSEFWTRLVLQCSQDEPVVRSALLALSYEHLDYLTRDWAHDEHPRAGNPNVEGLQQHHRAVRQLRRYIGTNRSPSIKAVLVCCILFYQFECSREDPTTALLHLRMGLAIWRNHTDADASPTGREALFNDPDMQIIGRTLSRLDGQASIMDKARMPELELVSESERRGIVPCVGPPHVVFENGKEADAALVKLQNWSTRFLVENQQYQHAHPSHIPPAIAAEKTELLLQFQRWQGAFEAFVANITATWNDETDPDARLALSEQRLGFYICLLHLHRNMPKRGGGAAGPPDLLERVVQELQVLVSGMATHVRPLRASITGSASRAGSTSRADSPEESGADEERSRSRQPSVARLQSTASARSLSPAPEAASTSRSFCASGLTIALLFVLAAKTQSAPFRDQMMGMLAQISGRREGVWSAGTALAVLSRLRDMAADPQLDRNSLLAATYSFEDDPDATEEAASDSGARGRGGRRGGARRGREHDETPDSSEAGSPSPPMGGDDATSQHSDSSSGSRPTSPHPRRRPSPSPTPSSQQRPAHRGPAATAAAAANAMAAVAAAQQHPVLCLSPRAREYASNMLSGLPFCAVAACMRRGVHGDQCLWCEDRPSAPLRDPPSLEDVGARVLGGFRGYERLLQEKGHQ